MAPLIDMQKRMQDCYKISLTDETASVTWIAKNTVKPPVYPRRGLCDAPYLSGRLDSSQGTGSKPTQFIHLNVRSSKDGGKQKGQLSIYRLNRVDSTACKYLSGELRESHTTNVL